MSSVVSRAAAFRFVGRACSCLIAAFAARSMTYAQSECPTECPGPSFAPGETYYVEIDIRFWGTTKEAQVRHAVEQWTYANTHNNNSGIRFVFLEHGSYAPPGANLVHVSEKDFTDDVGTPLPGPRASYQPIRAEGAYVKEATIFYNTYAKADPFSFDAGPYYEPNAPGYESVFAKEMRHELGHGMGLCEPANQQAMASVMNNSSLCPNENCNQQPFFITTCDNGVVSNIYAPPLVMCRDADGDGWCADNDCDDTNPFRQTDCVERCVRENCPPGWSWWWEFCTCRYGPCPVVVDTAGDHFALTDMENGVNFDLDGDGTPERLSWTAAGTDDAWLALDRDGNGTIDNGAELFGNFTPQPAPPPGEDMNGFLALAEFDEFERGGNGDGVIDGRDSVYGRLRLWRDANHNGFSEAWELHPLAAFDVAELQLGYKESKREDAHGNRFRYRAKVWGGRGAGLGRWAWDVFLLHEQ